MEKTYDINLSLEVFDTLASAHFHIVGCIFCNRNSYRTVFEVYDMSEARLARRLAPEAAFTLDNSEISVY